MEATDEQIIEQALERGLMYKNEVVTSYDTFQFSKEVGLDA